MARLPEITGDLGAVVAGHRQRLDDLTRRIQPLELDLTMRPSTTALRLTSTPAVANTVTTMVAWETADDPFGAWSASAPGELLVKRDGLHLIDVQLVFASNTTGRRWVFVTRNTTDPITTPTSTVVFAPGTGLGQGATGGGTVRLVAGDVIRAFAYQDSGAALAVQGVTDGVGSFLCMSWVGR